MLSLLKLQANILYLEKELKEIVAEDIAEGRDFHACFKELAASENGSHSDQLEMLEQIKGKLKEYSKSHPTALGLL